jgi:uncharacterized membrane protein YfcA
MTQPVPDISALAIVLLAAFAAGFTTGFAGFGTGLVASGLWFHVLPAAMVPPLAAFGSVVAQLVGLVAVRKAFAWRRVAPYLAGACAGVPLGVWLLSVASPAVLRTSVAVFLVVYALCQLRGPVGLTVGGWGGRKADGAVGLGGGVLGGFAGLSGPLPVIWLQLRGGPSDQQRAVYQPFNLIVLALAGAGMAIGGQVDRGVLIVAGLCLPVTLTGAWLGTRAYIGVGEATFRKIVLVLLLGSGLVLIGQTVL